MQNNCPMKHLVYDINCHCKHILQTFLRTDHLTCIVGREVYFSTRTTTVFFYRKIKADYCFFHQSFSVKAVGLDYLCFASFRSICFSIRFDERWKKPYQLCRRCQGINNTMVTFRSTHFTWCFSRRQN